MAVWINSVSLLEPNSILDSMSHFFQRLSQCSLDLVIRRFTGSGDDDLAIVVVVEGLPNVLCFGWLASLPLAYRLSCGHVRQFAADGLRRQFPSRVVINESGQFIGCSCWYLASFDLPLNVGWEVEQRQRATYL